MSGVDTGEVSKLTLDLFCPTSSSAFLFLIKSAIVHVLMKPLTMLILYNLPYLYHVTQTAAAASPAPAAAPPSD